MTEQANKFVQAALRNLMEPIIKLLLRNGVAYRDFARFCKSVYVDIAARDFGIDGRPTNVSRIALLTGIDRKEVKRVKDELIENTLAKQAQISQDRLTRLLSAWYQDERYVDTKGKPKTIPLDGPAPSFLELAKRHGGDVPGHTLLKELIKSNCVKKDEDGFLTAHAREYIALGSSPEALLRAGTVVNEISHTLFHNLYTVNDIARATPRFERRASNINMSAKKIKEFKAYLSDEGQQFLERVDDWLTDNEEPEGSIEPRIRLGAGLYGIESRNKPDEY